MSSNENGRVQGDFVSCEGGAGDYDHLKTPPGTYKRPAPTDLAMKRVKRRLFDGNVTDTDTDEEECSDVDDDYVRQGETIAKLKAQPTLDRFVYGDEVLDMRCALPGHEGASVMLTNVYNTLVHIVKWKGTLESLESQNRRLTIQLRAVEHNLRRLEENNFVDAHVQLPRMVESLFSMWDYRNNSPVFIDQLKPVSCVLKKKYLTDNISFRSMEAKSKNDSNYIEVMFNNPFRFIFVGCASRGGQHNKNVVNPFPFFGEYANRAIGDIYDVMYEMVNREVERAKEEVVRRDRAGTTEREGAEAAPNNQPYNGLQMMEAYSHAKQVRSGAADKERLYTYLRSIRLPLARRENVDILITSGNSGMKSTDAVKMRYLTVEKNKEIDGKGCLKIVENDVTEDAVYMSSYVRCRVLMLDEPAFGMQIYTRHAIKLVAMDDRLVKFSDFDEK